MPKNMQLVFLVERPVQGTFGVGFEARKGGFGAEPHMSQLEREL